jgi:hypothetical protein
MEVHCPACRLIASTACFLPHYFCIGKTNSVRSCGKWAWCYSSFVSAFQWTRRVKRFPQTGGCGPQQSQITGWRSCHGPWVGVVHDWGPGLIFRPQKSEISKWWCHKFKWALNRNLHWNTKACAPISSTVVHLLMPTDHIPGLAKNTNLCYQTKL